MDDVTDRSALLRECRTADRTDAYETLRACNPPVKSADVAMYADAFAEYTEAQRNLSQHGPLVVNEKTGQAAPNPYAEVRKAAMQSMRALNLKTGDLWTRERAGATAGSVVMRAASGNKYSA